MNPGKTHRQPTKTPNLVVQLRIELAEVEPIVLRRLLVPGSATLATLHRMLQAAMGWSDSHLHAFRIGETVYGMLDDDDLDDEDGEEIDESSVALHQAIGVHQDFVYEYDFGDGWEHRVTVEEVRPHRNLLKFAVCLEGTGACPPEDVGGPEGYRAFLVALGDEGHEDHDDLVEWIGGPFDPSLFDIGAANIALQLIR
jgi:hypothetical protein